MFEHLRWRSQFKHIQDSKSGLCGGTFCSSVHFAVPNLDDYLNFYIRISVGDQSRKPGRKTFLEEAEASKKMYREPAWEVKPIKKEPEPVKKTQKRLQVAGSWAFWEGVEPEPVKEIYKSSSQELGAGSFLEGAGVERFSRELVKKGTGSPTLIRIF